MGLPAWQSMCLQFDPRATRGHLMIGKDSRVKIKTERSVYPRPRSFSQAYKYKTFFTHRISFAYRVFYEDFSKVDALPSTNNKDKVLLIHENHFEVTNCAKNVKKTTNAYLILEDFNPPLYELPFHKEVPGFKTLLSISSENEEKVFNPEILTSKRVHTSLLLELSHRGPKAFKVIKIFKRPMEIFPCSYGEDIRVLDVPCLHFYPLDQFKIALILKSLVLAVFVLRSLEL
ncbi:hypothetical protein Tco_0241517 [Tanacetum coccineum]